MCSVRSMHIARLLAKSGRYKYPDAAETTRHSDACSSSSVSAEATLLAARRTLARTGSKHVTQSASLRFSSLRGEKLSHSLAGTAVPVGVL